ncbi:MAG: hypothetical protein ABMA64_37975 [Myxococcota bacterium]
MTDRGTVLERMRRGQKVIAPTMTEEERASVADALAELDGARAHVVVLEPGEALEPFRSLFTELQLDPERDLLVLFNGARWEAKGLGLDPATIAQVLDSAEGELARGAGPGLVAAVSGLGGAAGLTGLGFGTLALGAGGLAAALGFGGLGWVIARRNRLAREQRAELAAAEAEVEAMVASVVVGADGLGAEGRELQDRAARLAEVARKLPSAEPVHQRLGRLRQLEHEAVALQSQVLSSTRGTANREG